MGNKLTDDKKGNIPPSVWNVLSYMKNSYSSFNSLNLMSSPLANPKCPGALWFTSLLCRFQIWHLSDCVVVTVLFKLKTLTWDALIIFMPLRKITEPWHNPFLSHRILVYTFFLITCPSGHT